MSKRRTNAKARKSDRDVGRVTCPDSGRKVRYRARKQALTAANTLRAHRPGIPPLRVYHCDHCGDWHFTSQVDPSAPRRKVGPVPDERTA